MWRAFWISVATLVGLLLTLALVRNPLRWPAPEPRPYQGEAADVTKSGHTAAALGRLIREPQNTWSNLAFVVGGALLLGTARCRVARLLGIPLIAVGIGSFLYHASASARLRELDVGAMNWLFAMAIVLCVSIVIEKAQPSIERHA